MKHHQSPARLRLLLSLLAVASVGLAGVAQSAGRADPAKLKAPASASHFAGALQSARDMDRIVIKFKQPATTRAGAFSVTDAQAKVSALGSANKKLNSAAPDLRYLKSVTGQTHVALTSQKMSRAELQALARQLAQDPAVADAHIDEKAHPTFVPNDPMYATYQWHYEAPGVYAGGANLPLAWDTSTGNGVVVAVIDTGYLPHTDLAANILPGYDFADISVSNDGDGWDANAMDPGDSDGVNGSSWHGTHVAGTIAAVTNNSVGVAGVAYNARILPVRVLGVGGGYGSDIAAGMLWAAGIAVPGVPANPNKAKVLNLSLGGTGSCDSTYQDAVNQVRAAGSVVVAATGNDGAGTIGRPANCTGVIAVTAHTKNGDNASYANIGAGTTISAPGGGQGTLYNGQLAPIYVMSTLDGGFGAPLYDNNYAGYQGTSMATPHVAGVAALIASLSPGISPDGLATVLTTSSRPHPAGTYCVVYSAQCGSGMVDAKAALDFLISQAPTVSVSAPTGVQPTGSTITLTGTATAGGGATIASYKWTQTGGPTLTLNGSTTATLSFTAAAPGNTYTFVLAVTDNLGLSATSAPVTVTTNAAPVLNAVPARNVLLNSNVSFTIAATDAESNPLVYTAVGLPAGASLDPATGVFTWNSAGPLGNYSFTVTANDGIFDSAPQTVTINVVESLGGGGGGGGAMDLGSLLGLASLFALGLWTARRQRAPKK